VTGSRLIDAYADHVAGALPLDDLLAAVRRYALAVTSDEDVAQATAMHVWLHLADYDPARGSFPGWVRVIAQTIQERHRDTDHIPVADDFLDDLASQNEPEPPMPDRLRDLLLHGPDRELIDTALTNGVGLFDAGRLLGLTANQVRHKIVRIKNHIKTSKDAVSSAISY